LREALESLVGGRIDGVYVNPETGLVVLSVYVGEKKLFGAGIGPAVAGMGFLPRAPRVRASAAHPLVAALRAHLVDHRVRSATVDDEGTFWIAAGGQGAVARLAIVPGRRGEVRVLGPEGNLVLRWPPQGTAEPGYRLREDLPAAGAALVEASDRVAGERARAALLRAVRQRAQAAERRAEAVRGDLARLGRVEELQKIGRLLLAQGGKVPRGAAKATLQDWEEGGTIEVALDPARPAKTQAEAFFARARRYQRGEAVMQKRLAEAERVSEALRALSDEVAAAPPDPQALAALAARARALGVRDAPVPTTVAGAKQAKSTRRPFYTFRSANDRPILVGRGGHDNDALTTRFARPHDLWLHARGVAGAHVVVPLEKGQSCSPDLLVDAATLAAHFSDARRESVCDVSYVERRYVRKPRGSAPGAVTYDHEKVIAVRVEPDRLERLLATREE
jgi:hypothetical protein